MKKKLPIFLGLIALVIAGFFIKNLAVKNEVQVKNVNKAPPYIHCIYYDENSFMASVRKAKEVPNNGELTILGGITPHHLYADHMIAQFFKELSTDSPQVVILIGPNHERTGKEKIHTGDWDWQTPFGILKAEEDIVEQITEKIEAGRDKSLLEREHAIAALIPYVKYYLPEAKLVPLVVHGDLGLEKSKELADVILKSVEGKDILLIGSIDFSHYLPPNEAEQKDGVSIRAIRERDLLAISRMNNDYMDSPPTVITLLEMMNRKNIHGLKVLDHSNSAKIAGQYVDSTTSYFTILFHQ